MSAKEYKKLYKSTKEQIDHLKGRGLIIDNEDYAFEKLKLIGYERLRIYFLSKRDLNDTINNKPFFKKTSFRDIIKIYEADIEIRKICFDGVGRFETIFKNYLSDHLSSKYGSHPFNQKNIFIGEKEEIKQRNHILQIFLNSSDQRSKHYKENYKTPLLPPIWVLVELMTFGECVNFFQSLNKKTRIEISSKFNIFKDELFISWLKCLNDLRNICAHHGRLFNKKFQKQPTTFNNGMNLNNENRKFLLFFTKKPRYKIPSIHDKSKLFSILECLDYLLLKSGDKYKCSDKVFVVIKNCKQIDIKTTGFKKKKYFPFLPE